MISLVVIRAGNIEKLTTFYSTLGFKFIKHRHGKAPEHFSAMIGQTVFEIYPCANPDESTASTRLGFSVASLADALARLRSLGVTVLAEPSDSEFGRRAVVRDFEGHKVELSERGEARDETGAKDLRVESNVM